MPYRRPYAKSSLPRAFKYKKKKQVNPRLRLSRPLKTLVNKEINKSELTQTKVLNFERTAFNNKPDVQGDVISVFPLINQAGQSSGVASVYPVSRENRQGSKIRMVSLSIQGTVDIPTVDNLADPDRASIQCRLMCLSCKRYGNIKDVLINWGAGGAPLYNNILREGESAIEYPGYSWGNRMPVNTDLFTVHKDIKFNLTRGCQINGTAGSDGTTHYPYPIKHFKFNVKCKNKIVRYKDATANMPSNFAPFVLLMYSFQNGAAPSAVATVPYMELTAIPRWKSMA